LIIAATWSDAAAQGVLRVGITAADIPLTTGQTDQGGEGMRVMGYTAYDALILWDLSRADKYSDLIPGLATSWGIDPGDASKTRCAQISTRPNKQKYYRRSTRNTSMKRCF
jgi:ABC-type transport system substrate-binding protein